MIYLNKTFQIDTFIKIVPSGLVLSSLKTSNGMYGGLIEISRGQNQTIEFNPFLNTYDIVGVAVITSLMFKYSCQIIDSNIQQGYPTLPGTNQTINLDDYNISNKCFNSTSSVKKTFYS